IRWVFAEIDVDGGKDRDIFDINEGLLANHLSEHGRNSIIGDEYRWPTTIPYYFEDSVEINAKGVILKAFEQYRLKSCIDFKPWEGEANYISVFKGNGCFSSVGNRHVGKQQLSIGANCDRIATIEHEFLHALGFWHEQSRADRDDYVSIAWDRISAGKEHNFNTYDDTVSSDLNVPYDYTSMMHYSKTAFQNGSEPTIITKIPAFMDVIGQRMEFSDSDLLKLNRLYNCASSSTFLDTCSFELENICGMIQSSGATAEWTREMMVAAGPPTDFSNLGRCTGSGFFMHFSTAHGAAGDKGVLESRLLHPRRSYQCLQFFSYHSGSPTDQLNIRVREYDQEHPNGTLRFIRRIEEPTSRWELHHVTLNVSKKFRVVFEGVKGDGLSSGGLSIDDINLSETECPEHVWRVSNFAGLLDTMPAGENVCSPRFLSREGYTFQVCLYPNGTDNSPGQLATFFHLVSGDQDDKLAWPCPWKQTTMMLMDQNPDIRRRMSNQRSVTTDPTKMVMDESVFQWDDPRKVGTPITEGEIMYYRGPGEGTSTFLTQSRARSRDFIKGGDAIFLLTMEDVSHLLEKQETPTTKPVPPTLNATNDGVCVIAEGAAVCRCAVGNDWWYTGDRCQRKGSAQEATNTALAASLSVLAAMLVVTTVSVLCIRKKYKKQLRKGQRPVNPFNQSIFIVSVLNCSYLC
uniref:Meprin A subunit n=1 Tax=Scleropages formosus TaxID=113540 RepID=A0A8C9R6Y3_SCLFO